MPTRASEPDRRTHSCSLVYFRSVGYAIFSLSRSLAPLNWRATVARYGCLPLFRAFVKRHRHHRGSNAAAADLDLEFCPCHGAIAGQVRHPDRFFQERRLRPARYDAGLLAVAVDVVPVARDRAIEHLESDQLSRGPI